MPFITFEGIDGSGKSTQAERLAARLRAAGRDVALFREPGGTALAERVRSILLDPTLPIGDLAELLLFSAARAQLVEERIRPALDAGIIVVCDRFYDSTSAYQGGGRRVADPAWIDALNREVTRDLVPDRTYLMEIDPDAARARLRNRSEGPHADRMEQSNASFYRRVAETYARLAEREPHRFMRLDGARTVEEIEEEIWSDVQRLLAADDHSAGESGAEPRLPGSG